MYVEPSSHGYRVPSGTLREFHLSFPFCIYTITKRNLSLSPPSVTFPLLLLPLSPLSFTYRDVSVDFLEHLWQHIFVHGPLHLIARGPDVAQEHGIPGFFRLPNRVFIKIDVDGSRESVGDNEEGGGEVVCAQIGMDATYKRVNTKKNKIQNKK